MDGFMKALVSVEPRMALTISRKNCFSYIFETSSTRALRDGVGVEKRDCADLLESACRPGASCSSRARVVRSCCDEGASLPTRLIPSTLPMAKPASACADGEKKKGR